MDKYELAWKIHDSIYGKILDKLEKWDDRTLSKRRASKIHQKFTERYGYDISWCNKGFTDSNIWPRSKPKKWKRVIVTGSKTVRVVELVYDFETETAEINEIGQID